MHTAEHRSRRSLLRSIEYRAIGNSGLGMSAPSKCKISTQSNPKSSGKLPRLPNLASMYTICYGQESAAGNDSRGSASGKRSWLSLHLRGPAQQAMCFWLTVMRLRAGLFPDRRRV